MGRNINKNLLTGDGLFNKPEAQAPQAEPKVDTWKEIDEMAQRLVECAKYAYEEKNLRPKLLEAMQKANCSSRVTESGASVKVITTNRDAFDEEGFIKWAKENGHSELVKTKVVEEVDMEALEKLAYAEAGQGGTFTNAVARYTQTKVSVSLRVNAPKPKQGKEEGE